MAPPAGTLRVGRYFLALAAAVALLYAIVFWPGARHTPKLGLDLVGGTQVIFTAHTANGQSPSGSSMKQAQQIMEERVNGTGVTEATVVIQGSDQLVVSIPGSSGTDVQKLGAAAALNFRGLVAPVQPVACTPIPPKPLTPASAVTAATSAAPTTGVTPSGAAPAQSSPAAKTKSAAVPAGVAPNGLAEQPLNGPRHNAPTPAPTPATAPAATGSNKSAAPAATGPRCSATPFAALEKAGLKIPNSESCPSTVSGPCVSFSAMKPAEQAEVLKAMGQFDCGSAQDEPDAVDHYYLACDKADAAGTQVSLLSNVVVEGKQVTSASAVSPSFSQGGTPEWSVSLSLNGSGQSAWGKYTSAHNINGTSSSATSGPNACGLTATPCADYVAFTLDGAVISTPVNNQAINGGDTQVTGNFDQTSANDLANKLKFGALPLTFKAEQNQTVSATLGSSQLKSGLLAGGIGLILVIIYSLLYYRALGLVTISSLLVSGILTYGCLVMLGTQIGFTLSLAGIAGFIVAVGITADSFVVFFERIKDEVHEGRSMRVAIPRAWVRARRTILSADTVSFLAAAILYFFAAGDVRGFAFTLGLSTLLDLLVVFLFTHPLVSLLSRSKAFGSPRFTGLNSARVGGIVDSPVGVRPVAVSTHGSSAPATQSLVHSSRPADGSVSQTASVALREAEPEVLPGTQSGGEEPVAARSEQTQDDEPTSHPPLAGTAAERAAARRARMRAERDEKGSNR